MIRSHVIGCGAYLPKAVLTNHDLAKRVDTSDDWIVARTGIRERRVAGPGEKTSDLAFEAAHAALAGAGLAADDLDLVVCATTTPDETFPSVATKIQMRLGMTRGAAFDVQAVCSGFIYGLAVADNFIRCGQARTVLLIGAECMTRLLDWNDRTTCVLFGDGAGAVVLKAAKGSGGNEDRGVLNTKLFSDGRLHDMLYVDGGPSSTQTTGHLRMHGKEVFRHAVTNIAASIVASLDHAGLRVADIDWFVPHQANQRILDGTSKKLGIPHEKVVSTVALHGNTSAASVPLALATAVGDGRIKRGDLVLLEAMGGGITWGAALLRW
ncbi:MAG: ketoacyl-ACP synthase III [Alphaproteobacteria bacterium]|nr:ketoacyl-ACP synthase III [Alphaproteobacteria bacterium]MDE2630486.1 ketoacyl-ACP synthase III [Alphaproteobacteria bacterium]